MSGILKMSAEQYNQSAGLRSSHLKHLLKSPAHYRHAIDSQFRPTESMQLGTHVHTAVLEPDRFLTETVIAPKFDRRTTQGKTDAFNFSEQNLGKTLIEKDDMEIIAGCRKSILGNQKAAELLATGDAEGSLFWSDFDSNVQCKARPDFISRQRGYLVDLKTTQDASEFAFSKSIAQYFYHMQAAFYLEGMATVSGQRFERFFFIVVETSRPFGCRVFSLDFGSIEKGRELYKKALDTYSKAYKEEKWTGYEETIESIAIPGWAF